ncbi:hypothetical protein MAR_012920, partial [Mya arenaria]
TRNAELAEHRLQNEYKAKLNPGGEVIPDPMSLTSGWKCEKDGLASWPSVYITDIVEYFECGWVKEVHMHDISVTSDKCIMKAKVTL